MSKQFKFWPLVLLVILVSRFISMALFPFAETTEPRYAEIARLMAVTGDWITPWFEQDVPFWGKPPLSFWTQALAIKLFGLSEFAIRLPSWLAMLGVTWLTWRFARHYWNVATAYWAAMILASMALTYVSAGAVMTDAFLALGTTLSLVSFSLVLSGQQGVWRWLFFIGLAIGLLSKGPLALVLIGMPLVLWILLTRQSLRSLLALPWLSGSLLTVLLAGPWYLLAELKTPGFINYFIVGEHLLRFIQPGWEGDLYGSAHDEPKGMIWIFWLVASLPWGFIALPKLLGFLHPGHIKSTIKGLQTDPIQMYVVLCAVAPLLFFTLAGNILSTYVLPGLPFTALALARWVAGFETRSARWVRGFGLFFVPTLLTLFVVLVAFDSSFIAVKTEKGLITQYEKMREPEQSPLFYLGRLPFSARFYSQGEATKITADELEHLLDSQAYPLIYLATSRNWLPDLGRVEARALVESSRYRLWALHPLVFDGHDDIQSRKVD